MTEAAERASPLPQVFHDQALIDTSAKGGITLSAEGWQALEVELKRGHIDPEDRSAEHPALRIRSHLR